MKIEDLVVIDCEASGLGSSSYPIEVGISFNNESFGFLIKPPENWTYWCENAALIHKITRENLLLNGINVFDAVHKLNSQLRDLTVYSDAVDYEEFWLNRLYDQVGISKNFDIVSIYMLDLDWNKYKEEKFNLSKKMVVHRAENDAFIIRESIIKSII